MHIAILGNGIAGVTAARYIRKRSDHRISIISAETDYFFSRTALMYIYMGHMRYEDIKPYENFFWPKNDLDLYRGYVKEIDFDDKCLIFDENVSFNTEHPAPPHLHYDKLILAVGSKTQTFGWPGLDLEGVNGLVNIQDLEYMHECSTDLDRAAIVGGGLIGIEMAEMFHSRNIPVSFLVREDYYWDHVLPHEESRMVSRHIREHGIDLQLSTNLEEILGDEHGRVRAVKSPDGREFPCGFLGITTGVRPNIDFLRDSRLDCDNGILVNPYLETNIDDVYAIGDCAELRDPPEGRKPIEAVWYVGRIMGQTVAPTVLGNRTRYEPGIWFNSAKFLDIEYQVYGDIRIDLPGHHDVLYWEHPDGKRSLRIEYRTEDQSVVGFNLMGWRLLQEVCDEWIRTGTPLRKVVQNLRKADFDPEFHEDNHEEIMHAYEQKTGETLPRPKQKGFFSRLISKAS